MKKLTFIASMVLFSSLFSGCSTMSGWWKSMTRSSQAPSVGTEDEGTTKTYERETWFPWGSKKETPAEAASRKKVEKNRKQIFKKAKDGDVGSQIMLGIICTEGADEIPKNNLEAMRWFYIASKNPKATSIQKITAYSSYALCLEVELQTSKELSQEKMDEMVAKIIEYYKKAADLNFPGSTSRTSTAIPFKQRACYTVGAYYEKEGNLREALLYYSRGAELSHLESMYHAAKISIDGKDGLYNPRLAVSLLQGAAQKDYRPAQLLLADCYESGIGIRRDYTAMIRWLSMASRGDNGSPEAITKLGKCYALGKGVIQDFTLAFQSYSKAAERGYGLAYYELANCYVMGIGTPIDNAKGVENYKKAIEFKCDAGYYGLGICARDGLGMAQDLELAIECFEKGAKSNISPAQYSLARCYHIGIGVKKDMKKAIEYYQYAGENGYTTAWLELAKIFASGEDGIVKDLKKVEICFEEALDSRIPPFNDTVEEDIESIKKKYDIK